MNQNQFLGLSRPASQLTDCEGIDGRCTEKATEVIIRMDGVREHLCEHCFLRIVVEINKRLKDKQWARQARRCIKTNADLGISLRIF